MEKVMCVIDKDLALELNKKYKHEYFEIKTKTDKNDLDKNDLMDLAYLLDMYINEWNYDNNELDECWKKLLNKVERKIHE